MPVETPQTYATVLELCEGNPDVATQVMTEIRYFDVHGQLPADALFLQSIEPVGERFVIIWRDTQALD